VPCYSYSESIAPYYGQTDNAAANALNWSMGNILPNPPGLDINAVIYRYTINKETDASVNVTVQNEHTNGTGYIFRETDEWRPGSLGGTQINKTIPVVPTHRSLWGDGSIVTEGDGFVTEPSVFYSYRVEPCYDPQFDPNCPGYKPPVPDIPEIDYSEYYDVSVSQIEQYDDGEIYNDDEKEMSEEEKAEQEAQEKKDREERLEKALAAADTSGLFANALSQSMVLDTINNRVNINTYYNKTIAGGVYNDSVVMNDNTIQDNPSVYIINNKQDSLHKEMVDMQY
jgi:hypothetical protein